MVKVTLKTTLTNTQNRHPPGKRKPRLLPSPGVLPVLSTPLLVLAPDERCGEDQNFPEYTTHGFLLCSGNLVEDQDVNPARSATLPNLPILCLRWAPSSRPSRGRGTPWSAAL